MVFVFPTAHRNSSTTVDLPLRLAPSIKSAVLPSDSCFHSDNFWYIFLLNTIASYKIAFFIKRFFHKIALFFYLLYHKIAFFKQYFKLSVYDMFFLSYPSSIYFCLQITLQTFATSVTQRLESSRSSSCRKLCSIISGFLKYFK